MRSVFLPSFTLQLMHSNSDSHQVFACRCLPCVVHFLSPTTNANYFLSELSVLATIGSLEVLKALPSALASLSGHIDVLCEPTLVKLFTSLLAHKLWVVRQSAVHSVYPLLEGLSEGQSGVLQQFTDMATDT